MVEEDENHSEHSDYVGRLELLTLRPLDEADEEDAQKAEVLEDRRTQRLCYVQPVDVCDLLWSCFFDCVDVVFLPAITLDSPTAHDQIAGKANHLIIQSRLRGLQAASELWTYILEN